MSTPTENRTSGTGERWVPFQCPACFGLFRAQRERVGQIGQCPSCQACVRVSNPSTASGIDQVTSKPSSEHPERPPIIAKVPEIVESKAPQEAEWKDQSVKKRRYIGAMSDKLDWEESQEAGKKGIPWMLTISVITLVTLILAGTSYYIKTRPKAKVSSRPIILGTPEDIEALEASLALTQNETENEIESSVKEMIEQFHTFDLVKVRETIKNFLEAKTVEEKSRFVRKPERVLPLMQKFYDRVGYEIEGYRSLQENKISYLNTYISTTVRTKDFAISPIAVEKIGDRYLIDWESWVGHCEMSIEEMMVKKPTTPVKIRTFARSQDYYNYTFSDDEKWVSFRLTFSSDELALWGYLDRKSELYEKIEKSPSHPMILKVAYPENSRSKDQVQIVDWVVNGWVEDMKDADNE